MARLSNLRSLILARTKVIDEGLLALASLKKLETLDVRSTRVTESGVRRFQEAIRPRACDVVYDRKR